MLTFTSCRNSVRCKRWIQHQRFFSVASCLVLKAYSLGVWTGRRWVWCHSRSAGQQQMGNQEDLQQAVMKNHVALVATKRRTRSKNWWVPFHFTACLLEESGNSFRRSQFCHIDTACSTTSLQGMAAPLAASHCMGCCSSISPMMLWS